MTAASPVAVVTGLGLWAPGIPSVADWRARAGAADIGDDAADDMPSADVASSRSKRGTSRICRMLVEVVTQAARAADAPLADAAVVLASAWGEIDVMVALLGQIADQEPSLSPMRFKHSVHNAAGGLLSIATDNQGLSTSLAGGDRTFELGLVEAAGLLASGGASRVLLGVGEDRLPPPLDGASGHGALALGLCLEAEVDPDRRGRRLGALRWAPGDASPPVRPEAVPDRWLGNPTSWGLPLVDALARGQAARLPLGPSRGSPWVDVDAVAPARPLEQERAT